MCSAVSKIFPREGKLYIFFIKNLGETTLLKIFTESENFIQRFEKILVKVIQCFHHYS